MYMEHMTGKKDCEHKGESYAHGTELCLGDGCLVCNDGNFENNAEDPSAPAGVHQDPGPRNVAPEI